MDKMYISFYLRTNRIHIYIDALRGIGSPRYICFLFRKDGDSLAVIPYQKKGFMSHKVSSAVYDGNKRMAVTSMKLCQIISDLYQWEPGLSYRVPGMILGDHRAVVFQLAKAEIIDRPEGRFLPAVE